MTMAKSNKPSKPTGVKSLAKSTGKALNKLTLTAVALEMSSKVCPLGSALATISAATMPPAPGRFSITTGWPKPSAIFCATVRAVKSATPPAPNGTTMRKGLLGKFCAHAPCANSTHTSTKPHFFNPPISNSKGFKEQLIF